MTEKTFKTVYAAYGSNMDVTQMAFRCPDAKLIGTGEIKNYRLMFKGEVPYSYATIEEEENFSVPVVLWELSVADEFSLDRYEGCPKKYYKKVIAVETAEGTISNVMVYVMHEEYPLNPPDTHYYAAIFDAYEKFNLDTAILKEAMSFSDRYRRTFNFS